MDTNKNGTQGPVVSSTSDQKPAQTTKDTKKKKSLFNTTFRKIGFAFLFLFIGALLVSLALYLPARSSLLHAQTELERLQPIETEYISLQEEFDTINSRSKVYKILSNVNLLQVALLENETNRLNQFIGYVEDDLAKLELSDYPDLSVSLSNQFNKVSAKVVSDPAGAIEELQKFHNDLLVLIDNLE